MTFALFLLTAIVVMQFIVILWWARDDRRHQAEAQIRFLEHLNQRQDDIRGLTEALVRSEGKQVVLRPSQKRELGASWLDTKPPEAFIKGIKK